MEQTLHYRIRSGWVWGVVVVFALASAVFAQPGDGVIGWRNNGMSYYPDAQPPTMWSSTQNVVWSTPMPGFGNASPLIVGEKLFVCSEPDVLICVNKSTGAILWSKSSPLAEALTAEERAQAERDKPKADALRSQMNGLGKKRNELRNQSKKDPSNQQLRQEMRQVDGQFKELKKQLDEVSRFGMPPTNKDNGYSSPSPTSDGKNVYAIFGSGTIACYDLDGNRKWLKRYEVPTDNWGYSMSPVLVGGKLLVHVENMLALDPATGEKIWQANVKWSWGTPVPVKIGGDMVIVTPKGDILKAADGKVLARSLFSMEWGSPVAVDGIVYAIDEKGGWAFELPRSIAEPFQPKKLWQNSPPRDRYYSTVVVHDGLIYAVSGNGKKTYSVFDAKTGQSLFTRQLPFQGTRVYASVTLAGGNVYLTSEAGDTIILTAGRNPKEVATVPLEEFRSTPTFEGTRMYVRGYKKLYCFGK